MKTTMGKKALSLLLCLVMLLSMLPAGMIQTRAKAADTVAYPVEGGNIYFDLSTGTITSCGFTVTSAVIPGTINGIPVTTIGDRAFFRCNSLTDVYYCGSEEQWNNIEIQDCNGPLLSSTIHYNYNPGNPFGDVAESDYYFAPVLWAVEQGITNGTGKGKFSPDNSCTRGQIVTFLYRALA